MLCDYCGREYDAEQAQTCATCKEDMCEECLESHDRTKPNDTVTTEELELLVEAATDGQWQHFVSSEDPNEKLGWRTIMNQQGTIVALRVVRNSNAELMALAPDLAAEVLAGRERDRATRKFLGRVPVRKALEQVGLGHDLNDALAAMGEEATV